MTHFTSTAPWWHNRLREHYEGIRLHNFWNADRIKLGSLLTKHNVMKRPHALTRDDLVLFYDSVIGFLLEAVVTEEQKADELNDLFTKANIRNDSLAKRNRELLDVVDAFEEELSAVRWALRKAHQSETDLITVYQRDGV